MTPVAAPDVRASRRTDVDLILVTHQSVAVAMAEGDASAHLSAAEPSPTQTGADPAAAPEGGGQAW